MTITEWRTEIDDIDDQVLRLLNQRARLAVLIGKLKIATNQPLSDEARERGLIAKLAEVNGGPLDEAAIAAIFQQIIAETRRLEARGFATPNRNEQKKNSERSRVPASSARNSELLK